MNIIIPMAGLGSRFNNTKYIVPKPLIPINGTPMISQVINSLNLDATYHFVIRDDQFASYITDVVNSACNDPTVIKIKEVTTGPVATALFLFNEINMDEELILTNCDQIFHWNSQDILSKLQQFDGSVVTIKDSDPKHSYVELDADQHAIRFVEKEVISNNALIGFHYWKKAKYFFDSAIEMMTVNDRASNGEFYVAPTYNYLIKAGKRIGVCPIKETEVSFVGIPADLERYLNESR